MHDRHIAYVWQYREEFDGYYTYVSNQCLQLKFTLYKTNCKTYTCACGFGVFFPQHERDKLLPKKSTNNFLIEMQLYASNILKLNSAIVSLQTNDTIKKYIKRYIRYLSLYSKLQFLSVLAAKVQS